jgi:ribosomal protein S13
MYGIYPDHKVSVGETWEIETEMVSNGVALDVHNVYTLVSVEKGVAKIKFTGNMVMPETDFTEVIAEEIEAEELSEEELAELEDAEMKMEMAGVISGSLSVDIKTGMPITSKNFMEATIDMDMMGQKVPMEMDGVYTMNMLK